MTIKELRTRTGLSQSQFAEKFHISVRTLQRWEQDQNRVPEYVPYMIKRILDMEKRLSEYGKEIKDE